MARLPRAVLAGELHLVVHRGRHGESVFIDDDDYRRYVESLRTAARETGVAVHAYVLLPTQVRLLLTPPTNQSLPSMMQAIGRRYVRGFNLRHGRTGTPWEGRFRSTVVDASQHFLDCLRFVEGPPADGADARWSSAAHHLGLRADPLIAEHPAFWSFGNTPFEREASYQRAMQGVLAPDDRARVADAVIKGWALGSSDFASRVSEQSGRRAHPVARGRPRKPSP